MGHITTRCPTCPVRGTCLRKSHERNCRGRKVSLSHHHHHHPYHNALGLGAERRGGWDAGGYGGRYPAFRVQGGGIAARRVWKEEAGTEGKK